MSSESAISNATSQAWLAAILEATPDAIVVVASHDGQIVTVNAQAERLFGYERDELIGQSVDLLLPQGTRAEHRQHRQAFAADPRLRAMGAGLELVARRKDGHEIPVEISLSPLPTPAGLYVVSAIRDVTAKRQLDQERAHLAAIVASSGDAIIGTLLTGEITSWNSAAERLYGYPASEAVGRSVSMLLPPDQMPQVEDILDRIRHGETIDSLQAIRITRDGRRITVALTISPVRDHNGEVIGAATIVRDLTQRLRDEAALHENQARFSGAFASAAIGMALVGLDGRFLQVNPSLCQLLGYSGEELQAMSFQVITHPDDLEADLVQVQRLLDGDIPSYSLEKRYLHQSGAVVWTLLSVSLVRDEAGTPLYFVSQVQDVTRTREAERLREEFVSTVSHELRTPLTSIAGYVDLLLEGAGGELSSATEHFLTIVQQNSRRLAALVNDLLDMSRIEAGKIDLRQEEIDLVAVLHEVIASFTLQFEAKHQHVRVELPEALPPIWADPQRSVQIFTNLISNAHKYTAEGGSIAISAEVETDAVRVDVADTGIGMSAEEQEQIFTRFFRASRRAARAERGTGLGLAITHALVELHGGAISVRSALGEGTLISVLLPTRAARPASLPEEAPSTAGVAAPAARHSASGRILVVEDDLDVGNLLCEYLRLEGYETTLAATVELAIASVLQSPPDLITLDLNLTDGVGWSILDRLRAAGVALPPVVVVSILPENGYGRPLGVVDVLAKPISGSVLRDRVANALAATETTSQGSSDRVGAS